MSFNSIEFLLFLPIVSFLFFTLPNKFRISLLLLASIVFYMSWSPWYITLILFSALVDYFCGLKIYHSESKRTKKLFLYLSLTANLGLLGYFKYYNFFIDNINTIIGSQAIPYLDIVLPVGISFYTFQTLSYSIDIYFGKLVPEKNFQRFALYVTFFPQLVAGPIERATNLIKQLKEKQQFSWTRVRSGLQLIMFGVFKKVVIADNSGVFANYCYENSDKIHGLSWLWMTFFYFIQIYGDFSGYSDIARGSAQILGYDLMINFKQPLLSKSLIEFWSKWHISLVSWFKDYIFTPLSKGVRNKNRLLFNLFVIYFVSGLWHGATWNYVLWGVIHGVILVILQRTKKSRQRIRSKAFLQKFPNALHVSEVLFTFFIMIFTLIFFRNKPLSFTIDAYISMFTENTIFFNDIIHNTNGGRTTLLYFGTDFTFVAVVLFYILFLLVIEIKQRKYVSGRILLDQQPTLIRWGFYFFIIFSVIIGSATMKQPFVYFQF